MKRTAIAIAAALSIAPAFAQYDGPYRDRPDYSYRTDSYRAVESYRGDRQEFARVIDSQPVYASTREECWNPRTGSYEERERSRVGKGAAIGAIAGGVLGHQVDQGEGTAVGALLGGLLGHQIEKQERSDDLDYSRCRTAADSGAVIGYDVRYRYQGNEYVTRMANDPGRRLLVGRDVNWDGTPAS